MTFAGLSSKFNFSTIFNDFHDREHPGVGMYWKSVKHQKIGGATMEGLLQTVLTISKFVTI